jgi:hypothetical protein
LVQNFSGFSSSQVEGVDASKNDTIPEIDNIISDPNENLAQIFP